MKKKKKKKEKKKKKKIEYFFLTAKCYISDLHYRVVYFKPF